MTRLVLALATAVSFAPTVLPAEIISMTTDTIFLVDRENLSTTAERPSEKLTREARAYCSGAFFYNTLTRSGKTVYAFRCPSLSD